MTNSVLFTVTYDDLVYYCQIDHTNTNIHHTPLASQQIGVDHIVLRTLIPELRKILMETTNVPAEDSQRSFDSADRGDGSISSQQRRRRRRGHRPLTLDTIRRYKNEIKCRNKAIELNVQDNNRLRVVSEAVKVIDRFDGGTIDSQNENQPSQAQLQRELYNSKQTPLIPLVMHEDFLSILESLSLSPEKADLLFAIRTLLNSMEEEYLSSEISQRSI